MKKVEFWHWMLPRERDGKLVRSRWLMSDHEAAQYSGAVRAPGHPQVREIPETDAERQATCTAAINLSPKEKAALAASLDAEKRDREARP